MNGWQSGEVTANGLRLHYTRTGGGGPAVVLAHGFSDDGLCWTPVARALAPDYDVVMVDARGHGRSEGPEEGYGPAEHAADLAGVIDALGLARPAVLGHSMGGASTLALAGAFPDRVRAVLLEDPGPAWAAPVGEGTLVGARARMGGWVVPLKRKTREEMIEGQRAATPHWSEDELGPWADSKLRLSFYVLNRGGAPVDWVATLGRIACPALLLTADAERGGIVTEAHAASLAASVPHVRRIHIGGAGHSIRRDRFAAYMEAVHAFLRETV